MSASQILRSTAIIGGSSALSVVIGLVRTKVAALILGPAGIGLVGILFNLISLASKLFAWGIGNVTTRQIALAGDDQAGVAAARKALMLVTLVLASAGGLTIFLAREPIAALILQDPQWADEVGWLAVGVALLVATSFQNGLLTGMRRTGDVARVSVWSAFLGSLLGVGALLVWREAALLAFVLLAPAATFLVGAFFIARLPRPQAAPDLRSELGRHIKALAGLGLAFTIGAVALTSGQFAVRTLIQRELGSIPLGHFQAAWVISANYIGFILAAMATDYYPRLTSVIHDRPAATDAVNQQAEISLLLSGPVLVGTVGLAPWLIPLLYTSEFLPAVDVLRWQIVGDLFRIAAWPLGFILLASGSGRAFVLVQISASALFVVATALLIPYVGIAAAGLAYATMSASVLAMHFYLARRSIAFVPAQATIECLLIVATALAATVAATLVSPLAGAAAAMLLGPALGVFAVRRLHYALPEPLAKALAFLTRQ